MSQDKGMTMTSRSRTKCEGGEQHGQYELEDSEGKTKEKLTDIQTCKEGPRVGLGPYVYAMSLLAPAPVKRTTGGMGKSWEPAPHSDYQFCQYISPSLAHDSSPCNCMSSLVQQVCAAERLTRFHLETHN